MAVHYVETGEDLTGHTNEVVFGDNCASERVLDRGDVGRQHQNHFENESTGQAQFPTAEISGEP